MKSYIQAQRWAEYKKARNASQVIVHVGKKQYKTTHFQTEQFNK